MELGSSDMTVGGERSSVQLPLLEYAQHVGWTYIDPERAARFRHNETGLLFHDIFREQVRNLNQPWISSETIAAKCGYCERVSATPPGRQRPNSSRLLQRGSEWAARDRLGYVREAGDLRAIGL